MKIMNDKERDEYRLFKARELTELLVYQAKQHNFFVDSSEKEKYGNGHYYTESEVFIDKENKKVIKIKDIFKFAQIRDIVAINKAICMHIVHNIFFPETNYKLIGITEIDGYARFILEQPYINIIRTPSENEIREYIKNIEVNPDDIKIVDTHPNNIVVGEDDKLYAIDPMFSLRLPVVEIITAHLDDNEFVRREVETLAPMIQEFRDILENKE